MRASEIAYAKLREDIIKWRLEPGTPLGEIDTAARLGVSRTPVREAFSRLAAEGLVSTDAGRTVIVSRVTPETIRHLYEYREALETQAARLAARRPNHDLFAQLAVEFEQGPAKGQLVDSDKPYFLADRLDQAMDASVDNPFLVNAIRDLRGQMMRVRRNAHTNRERLEQTTREHLLIVKAVLAGDENLAAGATVVHLHNSLENVLALTAPLLKAASA